MPKLQKKVSKAGVTSGRLNRIEGVPEALERTAKLVKSFSSRQFKKEVCFPAAEPSYLKAKRDAPFDEQRPARVAKGWISERRHLRDAIFMAYGDDNSPNVLVGVNHKIAPHAHMIEYGTRAHHMPKKPTKGMWLEEYGKFVQAVKHPGIPATPFLRTAQSSTRRQSTQIMAQKLREFPDKVLGK